MSDQVARPEQIPETTPAPDVQELDAKVSEATPAAPGSSVELPPTSDNANLKKEVADQASSPAVEADSRLTKAQDASAGKPIEVKNFENSGVMSNDGVKTMLKDNLPPEHISGDKITDIKYTDEYRGDNYKYEAGCCITNEKTGVSQIEVNRQSPEGSYDRPAMEHTLVHEVGHNVYWNMSAEDQANWNRLSSSSRPDEYVSDYAQTNPKEDFAETYASHVLDPSLLKDVSPAKFNFMRDHVFNGRVYG